MVRLQKELFSLEAEIKLCDPEQNGEGFSLDGRVPAFAI